MKIKLEVEIDTASEQDVEIIEQLAELVMTINEQLTSSNNENNG